MRKKIHILDPHGIDSVCCHNQVPKCDIITVADLFASKDPVLFANVCKGCVAYLQGALDGIAAMKTVYDYARETRQ